MHLFKEEKIVKYLKKYNCIDNVNELREAISGGHFDVAGSLVAEIYETALTLCLTPVELAAKEIFDVLKKGNLGADISFMIDELEEQVKRVEELVKEKF